MTDQGAATGRHRAQALALTRHVGTVWVCDGGAASIAAALDAAYAEGQRAALAAAEGPCDNCASLKRHLEETTAHWVDAETRAKDRLGGLQEQLENEQRKERIAVKMATRAADLMAEAQAERDRAIEAAKAAVEAANNATARAEGRVGLLLQALDQVVRELDVILDQKGHTARTRNVLAEARAVLRGMEVKNGD